MRRGKGHHLEHIEVDIVPGMQRGCGHFRLPQPWHGKRNSAGVSQPFRRRAVIEPGSPGVEGDAVSLSAAFHTMPLV